VCVECYPEKGFVNNWLKGVKGGVLTNAGIRSNNKQEDNYHKSLNINEVSPIPTIPVDY